MIYSIFPKADTTCYQRYKTLNAGLDEILDLEKIVSSSKVAGLSNTRILMDFDLYNLSQSLATTNISPGKFYLNLYVATKNTPVDSQILYGYLQDPNWTSGTGKTTHNPISKVGASWEYMNDADAWTGASGPITNSAITTTLPASKSDIRADLTSLISSVWQISDNPGLIIQRPAAEELDGKRYGSIKFFSNDTSTVYRPKLDICYDDHTWSTGSLSALDTTKDYFVYLKNGQQILKLDTTSKFRFEAKEKYPTKTYVTSTTSTANKYIPSSSYYSIIDVKTGETIIPFDTTYTKISCDAMGNYANLTLSGLYPNRRYNFAIRVDGSDGEIKYHNLETSFMVVE